jgi:hypothetical protein
LETDLNKNKIQKIITDSISDNNQGFVFIKYINQIKKYLFEVKNHYVERYDTFEIRVHLKKKFIICTLKSVHDKSLNKTHYEFHSDGIFNRHNFLYNTNSVNPYFPESIIYRFQDNVASLNKTLNQINKDLSNQGYNFYNINLKEDIKYKTGVNFINKLNIDKDVLASELENESINGHFFKNIHSEVFKDLVNIIDLVWNYSDEEYARDYTLEDKKYYLSFNLLYAYINFNRKKIIRNRLYRK